ncbi:hypothetical protein NPIL_627261 [Nephila pilipes]|uniref:Uncharacterized protein n=1 Tax=Nephila pilipes TaxID=299642 RepID=A0A8X6TD53_NEPPI|nr:hypothetical protein NPIL_627261 [Nephila pilipes]
MWGEGVRHSPNVGVSKRYPRNEKDRMASVRTNKERSVRTLLSAASVNNVPSCWQHSNSVALSVRWLPPCDVRQTIFIEWNSKPSETSSHPKMFDSTTTCALAAYVTVSNWPCLLPFAAKSRFSTPRASVIPNTPIGSAWGDPALFPYLFIYQ